MERGGGLDGQGPSAGFRALAGDRRGESIERPKGKGGDASGPARIEGGPWYVCLFQPSIGAGPVPASTWIAIAESISPRWQRPRDDVLVIEAGGLERLIGGPQQIGEAVARAAAACGLRPQVAVAAWGDGRSARR
jgi:hypothetical protein